LTQLLHFDIIYATFWEVSTLKKLDNTLFRVASWLIRVAIFFGISRYQIAALWILAASLITFTAPASHGFGSLAFLCAFFLPGKISRNSKSVIEMTIF